MCGHTRVGPRRGLQCLTAACDKWENGESISSIDTGHASIEHEAKTDSDLARPCDSDLAQDRLGSSTSVYNIYGMILRESWYDF